jgi:uncharacterized membrane protein
MGEPELALGSLTILLINLLCINFTCTITFYLAGIKAPVLSKRMEKLTARSVKRRLFWVTLGMIILVAVIYLALRT